MFTYKKILTSTAIFAAGLMMATGAMATFQYDYGCDPEVELSPQVCFYTGEDFTGNKYCESGERTVNKVNKAPWNDNIESIMLIDGASVKIYNQYNRMGDMELVENSDKQLDVDFFNKVRSYRTVSPQEEEPLCETVKVEEEIIEEINCDVTYSNFCPT